MKTSRKQSGFVVTGLLLAVTVGGGLYALSKNAMTDKQHLDAIFTQAERAMQDPAYDPASADPFEQHRGEEYQAVQQLGAVGVQSGLKAVLAPLPGAGIGAGAVDLSNILFGGEGNLAAELAKVKQEAANPGFQPHQVTPPPAGDYTPSDSTTTGPAETTTETTGGAVGAGTCLIAGGTAEMTVSKEGNSVFGWLRMSEETLAETEFNPSEVFYYPLWYLNNRGEGQFFSPGGTVDIEASCTGQGVTGGGKQKIGYLGVVNGTTGVCSWGANHTWQTSGSGQYTVTFYVKGAAVGSVSTP